MKKCSKCTIDRPLSEFAAHIGNKDGLRGQCNSCRAEYSRGRRLKQPEYYREIERKAHYKKLGLPIPATKGRPASTFSVAEYDRKRRLVDINFKLSQNLRNRLRKTLQNQYKSGSAVRDLGCSTEYLKSYLEGLFKPGMNWDNYGLHGWHIDHILPLSKFDLTNREQFLKACHYTNLQPLWCIENIKKSNRETA